MLYFVNKSFDPKTKVRTFGKTPLLTTTRESPHKSNKDPAQPKKRKYNKQEKKLESFDWLNVCFCLSKIHILMPNPQFSSVAQSCPTICDPVDCSTPACLILDVMYFKLRPLGGN